MTLTNPSPPSPHTGLAVELALGDDDLCRLRPVREVRDRVVEQADRPTGGRTGGVKEVNRGAGI